MRIAYDHQIFSFQVTGGISRYFVQLLQAAQQHTTLSHSLILKYSNNRYLQDLYGNTYLPPKFLQKSFKGSKWILNYVNEAHQWRTFQSDLCDLVHPTYYRTEYLWKHQIPYVLTVHDMTHEKYPHVFRGKFDHTLAHKETAIRMAKHLIAISEHTKQDLIEMYNVDPAKISVIYHGIPKTYTVDKALTLPPLFFLYVGERGGYKNFEVVLKALAQIENQEIHLVCTGKPFNQNELQSIHNLGCANRVLHESVSDAALNFLYEQAQALIFPSFYEGFGFPIIEAMRAGCPILLAKASCFPEIAHDAALYFDPNNSEELKERILEVVGNDFNRDFWIEKGMQRFNSFTLEDSVAQTFQLYSRLINERQ